MRLRKRKSEIKVYIINKFNEQYNTVEADNDDKEESNKSPEMIDLEKRLAFETEALPHRNLLYNYAYRMLGNKLDADDMVQETYLRAFRFFDSYKRGTNCKAWLHRILKNIIINKFRKEKIKGVNVDYDEVCNYVQNIKSVHFDMDDYQQNLYSKLLDDEMIAALKSIHNSYMIVVLLCDLEGFGYEEIADFLHCPMGTVRSRLHRGRQLLQQKLHKYARQRGYKTGIAA